MARAAVFVFFSSRRGLLQLQSVEMTPSVVMVLTCGMSDGGGGGAGVRDVHHRIPHPQYASQPAPGPMQFASCKEAKGHQAITKPLKDIY